MVNAQKACDVAAIGRHIKLHSVAVSVFVCG